MSVICDCGRWFATIQDLDACAASGHAGSLLREVEDALATVPPDLRDEHWDAARQRLHALAARGTLA